LGPLFGSVSLTRDDFGNWYVAPGINFGKSLPAGVSASLASGGFLSVDPVSEAKANSVITGLLGRGGNILAKSRFQRARQPGLRQRNPSVRTRGLPDPQSARQGKQSISSRSAIFRLAPLKGLVGYYRERLPLEIETIDPTPSRARLLNTDRRQLVEKLIAGMRHALPKLANDPNALLIGFTTADMYPLGENWRFAFGWRVTQLRSGRRFSRTDRPALSGRAFGERATGDPSAQAGHEGHRDPLLRTSPKQQSA
jgi:hypothetical protein